MKDYYNDLVMGEWKHDKKKSTKTDLCYARRAEVKLHKDHALPYTDPETFVDYKVHGKIVLTETKLINLKTSAPSFFRGVEFTPDTVKDKVIK
jgi:hypothetical protein